VRMAAVMHSDHSAQAKCLFIILMFQVRDLSFSESLPPSLSDSPSAHPSPPTLASVLLHIHLHSHFCDPTYLTVLP
jgi:hypothetical protein